MHLFGMRFVLDKNCSHSLMPGAGGGVAHVGSMTKKDNPFSKNGNADTSWKTRKQETRNDAQKCII